MLRGYIIPGSRAVVVSRPILSSTRRTSLASVAEAAKAELKRRVHKCNSGVSKYGTRLTISQRAPHLRLSGSLILTVASASYDTGYMPGNLRREQDIIPLTSIACWRQPRCALRHSRPVIQPGEVRAILGSHPEKYLEVRPPQICGGAGKSRSRGFVLSRDRMKSDIGADRRWDALRVVPGEPR